jgi:hypothetical protein
MSETPIKPGSIELTEVKLFKSGEEYDLTEFILEISIYEDIFSNTMSATILMSDGANLIGRVPLSGGEILNIKYSVPGFGDSQVFAKAFYVYAIRDRAPASTDRQQIYMMSLMSMEAAIDNVTVVSKKFNGKTHEIAKEIFDTYLSLPRVWKKDYPSPNGISGEQNFTIPDWNNKMPSDLKTSLTMRDGVDSKNKVVWVPPMWSPMKCINWLANRHIDSDNEAPNTLFWETSQRFYFASIESIFKAQEDVTARKMYFYGFDDAIIKKITESDKTKNTLIEGYKKAEKVAVPTNFDVLRSQEMGHYSSTMYEFDVVTKRFKEFIWDYPNNFSKYEHLMDREAPTFTSEQIRNVRSYAVFRPKHKKIFDDYEEPRFEDWVLQRTSLLYDISNIKVEITVPGLTATEAGEVVQFYYSKMSEKGADENLENLVDNYMSGSYLVTAVRHIITPNRYTMKIEMVKESYATGLG